MLNSGEESLFQCRMACERLKVTQDFMVGEEKMLPRLLTFMDNVKKENPGKQLFLLQDSIATLDDAKYVDAKGESRGTTGKTPVYCTEALVDWAQQSYGIVIFICQVTKSGEFSGSNKIKHAIDIHGHLFVDEAPKSDTYGCLLFEVTKNRWGCNAVTTILQMTDTGLEERGTFRKAGATQ